MSSRIKKGNVSVVAAIPEAQLTNDQNHLVSLRQTQETYLKKHPLNVNPTFNKRPSLL